MEMERAAKSAQVVASIGDLLSKILCLLSLKDLLRFKSVSKHWRAFISDPSFCRLRNPNPNPAASGIFLPPLADQLREYVPFSTLKSGIFRLNFSGRISQSCNGLLLVESSFRYRVYNPTTNCCSELPEPPDGGGCSLRIMNLVFDPVKSRHYKVVCTRYMYGGNPIKKQLMIEMYSSETRSWEVSTVLFPATTVNYFNGVYWNGAVHWLGIIDDGGLYFQVENRVLRKMPILPFRHGDIFGSNNYLGHSCDHLHLIKNPDSGNPFDVYEMKRDYSEWFVKYRVDLSPAVIATKWGMDSNHVMPARIGGNKFVFCVLNVIRGEADEDSFLVVMTPYRIIQYNIVSETFENLYELESLRFPEGTGAEYIESLCCCV